MAVFVTSPLFNKNKVPHGFFTRVGGVSEGAFSSLNCSTKSRDAAENVRENLSRVAKKMGFQIENLYGLEQIHTTIVHKAENSEILPKGDAIFTADMDKLLGVQTADCAPILLYASDIGAVSAVHAGWRGAVAGVIQAAVSKLEEIGANPDKLLAAIGPCIQQTSYEVSESFALELTKDREGNDKFFSCYDDKWFFNLPRYCRQQLWLCGVKQVDIVAKDTYSDAGNFFSFRRYTHECAKGLKEQVPGGFGCQISVIARPR